MEVSEYWISDQVDHGKEFELMDVKRSDKLYWRDTRFWKTSFARKWNALNTRLVTITFVITLHDIAQTRLSSFVVITSVDVIAACEEESSRRQCQESTKSRKSQHTTSTAIRRDVQEAGSARKGESRLDHSPHTILSTRLWIMSPAMS